MIELRLTVDEIDYTELINTLLPLIVKNKFAEKTLKTAISAKFASMNESEKNEAAIAFINDNASKIADIINEYVTQEISGCHVTTIEAK